MKSKSTFGNIISLALIIVFLSMGRESFAQEEIAQAYTQDEEIFLDIPKADLKYTLADTVLPTICNSGRGLIHFDRVSLPEDEKDYSYDMKGDRNLKTLCTEGYTESEMKVLQEQKRLMQEQFNDEWQQQLRKERMELNLGEVIKSFYLKPVF